jgi:hypothetical protein
MMNKKMIELMEWLRPYTPDERLEMLLEAARTTGYKELERAIIGYWFDKGYREVKEKRNEQIEKII